MNTAYNLIDAHGPAQQRSESVAPTDKETGGSNSPLREKSRIAD